MVLYMPTGMVTTLKFRYPFQMPLMVPPGVSVQAWGLMGKASGHQVTEKAFLRILYLFFETSKWGESSIFSKKKLYFASNKR